MEMGNELEGMFMLELARQESEAIYAKNPLDADNLTKWGGTLMDLAQFQPPKDSKKMLADAMSKLEEALAIDSKKHDAMWTLANAFTTHGLMTPNNEEATSYFLKAANYFQQALDEDPGNEIYKKSSEILAKAPEIHAEIHQRAHGQQGQQAEGSSSDSSKTSRKKKPSNNMKYDVMGWVILGVGILTWLGFSKNHMPQPSPI